MSFLSYYKPSKKNISLAGVILISQLGILTIATIANSLVFPDYLSASTSGTASPGGDVIIFGGFFLSAYVASCSSIWWLEEHL